MARRAAVTSDAAARIRNPRVRRIRRRRRRCRRELPLRRRCVCRRVSRRAQVARRGLGLPTDRVAPGAWRVARRASDDAAGERAGNALPLTPSAYPHPYPPPPPSLALFLTLTLTLPFPLRQSRKSWAGRSGRAARPRLLRRRMRRGGDAHLGAPRRGISQCMRTAWAPRGRRLGTGPRPAPLSPSHVTHLRRDLAAGRSARRRRRCACPATRRS